MLKPICVACQRFYRVKRNGYTFIEAMPDTNDVSSGSCVLTGAS